MTFFRTTSFILILAFFGTVCTIAVANFKIVPLAEVDAVYPLPAKWKGLKILHIGDSNVALGLTNSLRQKFNQAGSTYVAKSWSGSRSKTWISSGRLQELLRKHNPNIVIITLGTNAIRIPHPAIYSKWIKAVVKKVGSRQCYWLGPPPLLDDAFGFNEMLINSTAPCKFFDTRSLDFAKTQSKKYHLTFAQGKFWANKVWTWMNGHNISDKNNNSALANDTVNNNYNAI